jgi:hypothetical protein
MSNELAKVVVTMIHLSQNVALACFGSKGSQTCGFQLQFTARRHATCGIITITSITTSTVSGTLSGFRIMATLLSLPLEIRLNIDGLVFHWIFSRIREDKAKYTSLPFQSTTFACTTHYHQQEAPERDSSPYLQLG